MRVARELPKLAQIDPANTPRVADLSFRQVLELLASNAETARTTPAQRRPAVLDRADQADKRTLHEAANEIRAEDRQRRQREQWEAERQRREAQRQRLDAPPQESQEVAAEQEFLPSELGPPLPTPSLKFDAEGGYEVVLSTAQLEALRQKILGLEGSVAYLIEHLTAGLGPDHPAVLLARRLGEDWNDDLLRLWGTLHPGSGRLRPYREAEHDDD